MRAKYVLERKGSTDILCRSAFSRIYRPYQCIIVSHIYDLLFSCSFDQRSTRHMRRHLSRLPTMTGHGPPSCYARTKLAFLFSLRTSQRRKVRSDFKLTIRRNMAYFPLVRLITALESSSMTLSYRSVRHFDTSRLINRFPPIFCILN